MFRRALGGDYSPRVDAFANLSGSCPKVADSSRRKQTLKQEAA
jgi:hypothetical protein